MPLFLMKTTNIFKGTIQLEICYRFNFISFIVIRCGIVNFGIFQLVVNSRLCHFGIKECCS